MGTVGFTRDQQITKEIISICLELDKAAVGTYKKFSELSADTHLKKFWMSMSKEESVHVSFWEELMSLAEKGEMPMLLDDPETVLSNLKKSLEKVNSLSKTVNDLRRVADYFTYALRLEFFVLEPAFEAIFYFMKNSLPKYKSSATFYENHLSRFTSALKQHGESTPELELIGEAINKLWETNKDMVLKTSHDPLSSLLNRRGFNNTILPLAHLAARNGMTIGVLMMDIDNFKSINDTYGHQKGDEVIKSVAEIIKSSIRASDVAGRYGGEEFIVYLPEISSDTVYAVAEKIRSNIEERTLGDLKVTISIGSAEGRLFGDIEKDIEDLLKRADNALYKAKSMGKNRVVVA
ncbi:MAG: GGDEF domain-containing protein [Nitrospirae bacterium]|nr:GGDEF domain-containing protein [Nitrospirota bacterium]